MHCHCSRDRKIHTQANLFDGQPKLGPSLLAGLLALLIIAGSAVCADDQRQLALQEKPVADNGPIARGFAQLIDRRCDRAIACLTPALIQAGRGPLSNPGKARQAALCLMLIGRSFQFDENEVAAAQAFALAHALEPKDSLAAASLAEMLIKTGRIAEADHILAELEPLAGHDPAAARALAYRASFAGDKDKAIDYASRSLKLDPANSSLLSLFTKTLMESGRLLDAARACSLAAEAETSPYQKELFLAYADELTDKEAAAVLHYRAAGRVLPDEPAWQCKLAYRKLLSGEHKQALAGYIRASQSRRLSSRAWTQLAFLLAYINRRADAYRCLDHLGKLKPWSPDPYTLRGQLYEADLAMGKAEAEYKKAIALNPLSRPGYHQLIELYRNQSKLEQALSVAHEYVKWCGSSDRAWWDLARSEASAGQLNQAIAAFHKALALSPQELAKLSDSARMEIAKIHAELGAGYYRNKQMDDAREQATIFNQLKPVQPPKLASVDLNWFHTRPPKLDLSRFSRESTRGKAIGHAALADMLYEAGEDRSCLMEYRQAVALDPDNLDWHMCLFAALMRSKNYLEAFQEDLILANKIVSGAPRALKDWQKRAGSAPATSGKAKELSEQQPTSSAAGAEQRPPDSHQQKK